MDHVDSWLVFYEFCLQSCYDFKKGIVDLEQDWSAILKQFVLFLKFYSFKFPEMPE